MPNDEVDSPRGVYSPWHPPRLRLEARKEKERRSVEEGEAVASDFYEARRVAHRAVDVEESWPTKGATP